VGKLGYLEERKSSLKDHNFIFSFPFLYMVAVFIGKEVKDVIRGKV
jgi:hypothetical protein